LQEAAYDAELQSGLEAQKKLREQILRRKEMRRQMQVQERRHELTQHHQQQQPVTAPGHCLTCYCCLLLQLGCRELHGINLSIFVHKSNGRFSQILL